MPDLISSGTNSSRWIPPKGDAAIATARRRKSERVDFHRTGPFPAQMHRRESGIADAFAGNSPAVSPCGSKAAQPVSGAPRLETVTEPCIKQQCFSGKSPSGSPVVPAACARGQLPPGFCPANAPEAACAEKCARHFVESSNLRRKNCVIAGANIRFSSLPAPARAGANGPRRSQTDVLPATRPRRGGEERVVSSSHCVPKW